MQHASCESKQKLLIQRSNCTNMVLHILASLKLLAIGLHVQMSRYQSLHRQSVVHVYL